MFRHRSRHVRRPESSRRARSGGECPTGAEAALRSAASIPFKARQGLRFLVVPKGQRWSCLPRRLDPVDPRAVHLRRDGGEAMLLLQRSSQEASDRTFLPSGCFHHLLERDAVRLAQQLDDRCGLGFLFRLLLLYVRRCCASPSGCGPRLGLVEDPNNSMAASIGDRHHLRTAAAPGTAFQDPQRLTPPLAVQGGFRTSG